MENLKKSTKNNIKVLIIEDSLMLSQAISSGLKKEGFETFVVADGEEGLKTIKKYLPDIVLLDIIMPVLDGMEVLEKIKDFKKKKGMKIFMLTNLSAEENIEKCFSLGADDYLVKANFTIKEIAEKIKATTK